MNKNYYLSLWIANLGVEPLFSIAFFLLRPAFFSLNFLLTLVCVVLDAITLSLKKFIKSLFRSNKLTILFLFVKVFVYSITFAADDIEQDIFLAKGEQRKIRIKGLRKFSIGNKEVISVTYKNNFLFIKGKSIGFSDIAISSKQSPLKLKIFVVNKRQQLKTARIAQSFKKLGLSVNIDENLVTVRGKINSKPNYVRFMNLIKQIKSNKTLEVKLDLKLRNLLISEIYQLAYRNGASFVSCENVNYQLYCNFRGLDFTSRRLKQIFANFFIINTPNRNINKSSNYKLSFKIFKVNKSTQNIRDIGPSKISAGLREILNKPLSAIMDGDLVDIRDTSARVKVIAQPTVKTILEEEAKVDLGGEFPVVTTSQNGPITNWKFYGLMLSSKIKIKNEKVLLKYRTNLSTPFEENISTTGGNASLFIPIGNYVELFKINFDQRKLSNESIPLINRLPILRNLFASNNKSKSTQEIICFVKIEVNNE